MLSVRTGHFTRRDARERLLLVNRGECYASHAEDHGSRRLIVLDGEQVLADVEHRGGSTLGRLEDVDRDGLQEVIVESCGFTFRVHFLNQERAEPRSRVTVAICNHVANNKQMPGNSVVEFLVAAS